MSSGDAPDFESGQSATEYWKWLTEQLRHLSPVEDSEVPEPEPLF